MRCSLGPPSRRYCLPGQFDWTSQLLQPLERRFRRQFLLSYSNGGGIAAGWIGQYPDETPDQLLALQRSGKITLPGERELGQLRCWTATALCRLRAPPCSSGILANSGSMTRWCEKPTRSGPSGLWAFAGNSSIGSKRL
jgi:hypothetical protein